MLSKQTQTNNINTDIIGTYLLAFMQYNILYQLIILITGATASNLYLFSLKGDIIPHSCATKLAPSTMQVHLQ